MMKIEQLFVLALLVAGSAVAFITPRPSTFKTAGRLFVEVDDDVASDDEMELEKPTDASSLGTFESLGLDREIMSAVRGQAGWDVPTPIQQLAIPEILSNDEAAFWCEAPTGSGKTAAYALPLLQKLKKKSRDLDSPPRISALVLCPTRELSVQIGRVFDSLAYNVQGRKEWYVQTIHGGVPIEPQISEFAQCVQRGWTIDVLVATPGRLADVMTYYKEDAGDEGDSTRKSAKDAALERRLMEFMDKKGSKDTSINLAQIKEFDLDRDDDDGRAGMLELLKGLQYLIIDEADRLLSRAFEKEVDACLKLLVQNQKEERGSLQTLLFSATFPKHIEPRVDHVLKKLAAGSSSYQPPIRISCSASDRISQTDEMSNTLQKRLDRKPTTAHHLEKVGPASTIKLRTIRIENPARTQGLLKLLVDNPDWDRVLVFVATRYASEHIARKLRRKGIESAELHGKLDQEARLRRLRTFAKRKIRVLLATDLASRGLDVKGLPVVVNYDLPRSTTDFVHRIGRTGRAGNDGLAVTFVTPQSEAHYNLIEQRHLPNPPVRETLQGFEPREEEWEVQAAVARMSVKSAQHSKHGLAHDKMYGGIKGRRKSKKDRLREKAARKAQAMAAAEATIVTKSEEVESAEIDTDEGGTLSA